MGGYQSYINLYFLPFLNRTEKSFVNIIWQVNNIDNESSFYDLEFNDKGFLDVNKIKDNQWVTLIGRTYSSTFNDSGESNRVTIAFNDNTSEIYVNDKYVGRSVFDE